MKSGEEGGTENAGKRMPWEGLDSTGNGRRLLDGSWFVVMGIERLKYIFVGFRSALVTSCLFSY